MSSLSFSVAVSGGEGRGLLSGSHICTRKDKEQLPGFTGIVHVGRSSAGGRHRFCVMAAKLKKGKRHHEYPWPREIDPNLKSGHLSYLSYFKPLAQKPKPVILAFEKPLRDMEKKIMEVRKIAESTGLDFSDQIGSLENKYQQALMYLYTHLKPIQRLQIARHPNRPTFLDHVLNMTDKFVELHGDRAGYDDPAIVAGIGSIDGKSYMFIGHQKGRNTKEHIQRNFGMPTPHGYRKALRMMRYADHHGMPIITLIDTPGAFADLKCEELGQGEAIAFNLREMFSLKVPIVSVVIGEGGSGGALAIGCANRLLMLSNAVFYVASPEACAAILWKTPRAAPKAAAKLKITAPELCKFKIADGIIPEPLGGAHTDPAKTSQQIKLAVTKAIAELETLDTEGLLKDRHRKFRIIGGVKEGQVVTPDRKRNMKRRDINISSMTAKLEAELDNLRKKACDAKSKVPIPRFPPQVVRKSVKELDKEITNAFISMGLQEKVKAIKLEISKSSTGPDQPLSPVLQGKIDRLVQDFSQGLSRPGSYLGLKQKLETLNEVSKLTEYRQKSQKLKKEINEKLRAQVKGKMEILQRVRDKVAKGEPLSKEELEEAEIAKEGMVEALKSTNLEFVGLSRTKVLSAPPTLKAKIAEAEEVIGKEIEKAVNEGGLRGKMDELREALKSNSSKERAMELLKEIREGIAAGLNEEQLMKKVESIDGISPVETSVSEESSKKSARLVQEATK